MEKFDAIIIGAGLAGLQCARLLGKRGLSVLLVDRKPTLDQSFHTTGIFVRRTLEDFDIPEDCLGPPVRHVSLYSPARRALELVSEHDEFRIGRMGWLYNRYLNQCLRADVRWMPETRYVGHVLDREDLIVHLSCGAIASSVRARYLIGGDGAKSRVARDLQLDTNREWIVGVENVLTHVDLEGPPRLLCFLDPTLAPGYLAWVAHDGEEAHIGVGGYPGLFDPATALQQFQSSLSSFVDLRNARQIDRRGGRIPVGGVLRNIANPHGMLIGDAAGAVSPLTAGGLDPCMRLSTLAAEVVANYLVTRDPKSLAVYSGQLYRSKFTSRLWARRVASSLRYKPLIEAGFVALRLPLLRGIARQVFFGRGSFPDVEMGRNSEANMVDDAA